MTGRTRHGGFTLVELLVVVAIISLLVTILMPSLNRAKALARTVVCTSNLRSIGMGCQIYLHENNNWFCADAQPTPDGKENVVFCRIDHNPAWGEYTWMDVLINERYMAQDLNSCPSAGTCTDSVLPAEQREKTKFMAYAHNGYCYGWGGNGDLPGLAGYETVHGAYCMEDVGRPDMGFWMGDNASYAVTSSWVAYQMAGMPEALRHM